METTFYDDNLSVKKMKTSMTLDLSSMPNMNKHEKLSDLLTTPDVGLFISTPDLERWITHQQGNMVLTTPTPTDASQILFPKTVTEEQEAYARGFIDALGKFYENPPNMSTSSSSTSTTVQSNLGTLSKTSSFGQVTSSQFDLPLPSNMKTLNSVTFSNILSYNSATNTVPYSNNTNNITKFPQPKQTAIITTSQPSIFHHQTLPQKPIKVETYQTVPLSPPNNSLSSSSSSQSPPASMSQNHISPINMEDQEMAKLERKRARNRIAATRCRNRKLERIARLEDRVNELKDQNLNLAQTASLLREQVLKLKQTIVEHTQQGCQVMLTSKFLDSSAIFN